MTTEATIEERAFTRLAQVARATRQGWAERRLTGPQNSPYSWSALAEIVVLRELRKVADGPDLDTVWKQIRSNVASWQPNDRATALVNLHTCEAYWSPDDRSIARALASGHPCLIVDFDEALSIARRGFDLGADAKRYRLEAKDEVSEQRKRSRRRGSLRQVKGR